MIVMGVNEYLCGGVDVSSWVVVGFMFDCWECVELVWFFFIVVVFY